MLVYDNIFVADLGKHEAIDVIDCLMCQLLAKMCATRLVLGFLM